MKHILAILALTFTLASPASASWASKMVKRNSHIIVPILAPGLTPVVAAQEAVKASGVPQAAAQVGDLAPQVGNSLNAFNGAAAQLKGTLANVEAQLGVFKWPAFVFSALLCLFMLGKVRNTWRRAPILLTPAR